MSIVLKFESIETVSERRQPTKKEISWRGWLGWAMPYTAERSDPTQSKGLRKESPSTLFQLFLRNLASTSFSTLDNIRRWYKASDNVVTNYYAYLGYSESLFHYRPNVPNDVPCHAYRLEMGAMALEKFSPPIMALDITWIFDVPRLRLISFIFQLLHM